MKVRPLGFFAVVVVMSLVRPLVAQHSGHTTGCTGVNWPALESTDPAYPGAMGLARVLADNGLAVECIGPSKMASTFEGLAGAALYQTNRGTFEVLFLPDLQNFDKLLISEREVSGRYLYTFTGPPKPWPANLIDAARPVYFIKSLNRLLVAHDKELASHLGAIFSRR
jgi:hypothetical protein